MSSLPQPADGCFSEGISAPSLTGSGRRTKPLYKDFPASQPLLLVFIFVFPGLGARCRCNATENRLHIYRRPCCTAVGAGPDTNRSAGLHSRVVFTPKGSTCGLPSSPAAGLTCVMHLREHIFFKT